MVYVAAEGGRTEGDYVRLLNEVYGRRPAAPFSLHFCDPGKNGARPEEVVELVLASATGPDDERWALFDRDASDERDHSIRAAHRKAAEHGVQVALSHPSFELWLLLHFQQFTGREGGGDTTVKDRLRRHPDAKGFERYDTASGGRGKGLDDQRRASLTDQDRTATAVRHARRLVDGCPHGSCSHTSADTSPTSASPEPYATWAKRTGHAVNCDPLLRDPSSDVWRLLVSLGVVEEERRTETKQRHSTPRRRRRPPS